jgi:hypothetical protein
MDIELNEERIYHVLNDAVTQYKKTNDIDVSLVCEKMDELVTSAEHCKDLVQNCENMNPEKIYKTFSEFAFIYAWNDYDFISIINMSYGMKFVGEKTIPTTMQSKFLKTESDGWKEVEAGVDLRVLYTQDTKLDNHDYSIKEIHQLLSTGQILILEAVEGKQKNKNYIGEPYHYFGSVLDKNPEVAFLNPKSRFYPYTLQYIKEQLTKEKLKKLFFDHLEHVNIEFSEAADLHYENWKKRHVNEECQRVFKEKGITRRLVKLNETKKKDL